MHDKPFQSKTQYWLPIKSLNVIIHNKHIVELRPFTDAYDTDLFKIISDTRIFGYEFHDSGEVKYNFYKMGTHANIDVNIKIIASIIEEEEKRKVLGSYDENFPTLEDNNAGKSTEPKQMIMSSEYSPKESKEDYPPLQLYTKYSQSQGDLLDPKYSQENDIFNIKSPPFKPLSFEKSTAPSTNNSPGSNNQGRASIGSFTESIANLEESKENYSPRKYSQSQGNLLDQKLVERYSALKRKNSGEFVRSNSMVEAANDPREKNPFEGLNYISSEFYPQQFVQQPQQHYQQQQTWQPLWQQWIGSVQQQEKPKSHTAKAILDKNNEFLLNRS